MHCYPKKFHIGLFITTCLLIISMQCGLSMTHCFDVTLLLHSLIDRSVGDMSHVTYTCYKYIRRLYSKYSLIVVYDSLIETNYNEG